MSNYIDHDDKFELFDVGNICQFRDYKKAGFETANDMIISFATRFFLSSDELHTNEVGGIKDAIANADETVLITGIENMGKVNRETIWKIDMVFQTKLISALLTKAEASCLMKLRF